MLPLVEEVALATPPLVEEVAPATPPLVEEVALATVSRPRHRYPWSSPSPVCQSG
jgi:hypothetical protein